MEAGELIGVGAGDLQERERRRHAALIDNGELRLLPHPHVRMAEQRGQTRQSQFVEAPLENFLRLAHHAGVGELGIGHAVDAALARFVPALHPVRDVEVAVVAEVAVRHQHLPEELMPVGDLEARALGLHAKGMNAAARAAAKVAEEEVIRIAVWQAESGIIRESGRAVADVGNGRNEKRRLSGELRIAHPLAQPHAARIGLGQELIANAPTAVSALNHIHPACRIAAVGIVIARPEIAVSVEGQFLRVAQAARENFQLRAVAIAAIDRTFLVIRNDSAVLVHHMRTTIPDGEIQPAIRSDAQPVQIMAEEARAHAEAVGQRFLRLGHAVLVVVAQEPEVRDVRVIDVTAMRENAGPDALGHAAVAAGKDGGLVSLAVAIAVPDHADAILLLLVVGDAFALVTLHDLDTFVDRGAGEFLIQPVHVTANVRDAGVQTERFSDVEPALLVDGKADRIGQERLGSEELDLEPLGHAEAFDGRLAFVRGGSDLGRARVRVRHELGGAQRGARRQSEGKSEDQKTIAKHGRRA